jgi:hypothetical protein
MEDTLEQIHTDICRRARAGCSLEQISSDLYISLDEVVRTLAMKSQLTPPTITRIFEMQRLGLSTMQTSRELAVANQTLRAFLPEISSEVGARILSLKAKGLGNSAISRELMISQQAVASYNAPHGPRRQMTSDRLPEVIAPMATHYLLSLLCYKTNAVTGLKSPLRYIDKLRPGGFSWAELPGENLLITGGIIEGHSVYHISAHRDYAVTSKAPMIKARAWHSSVYYAQYLYVIGGQFKVCERYVSAEDRWEVFGKLPGEYYQCMKCSCVLMEATRSIYVVGGNWFSERETVGKQLPLIWRLSLESLSFELLNVKLPTSGSRIPCFKLSPASTEFYLVLGQDLYSFTPSTCHIKLIRRVSRKAKSLGACWYFKGTLHFFDDRQTRTLFVGDLS